MDEVAMPPAPPPEARTPGTAGRALSRRRFLRGTASVTAGLGLAVLARRAAARSATLRIAQWAHFVPAFDEWFDKRFAREWGERNGVTVVVDHVSVNELRARATVEAAAQQGHDLFAFFGSPAGYEDLVVPVTDVVGDCERRFGRLAGLAHKATFSPRSKQYFAFSDSWVPAPLHYRTDWWGEAGLKPDTWEQVREGARRIRDRHGAPAGFGLAPEPDTNMVLRGLLWSFGAAEQDEAGNVTINSRGTIEAIKLMTAIFKESMSPDVFMWDPASNNRLFVWGRGSIIQNAVSAIRQAERQNPEVARRSALAPPPAGPAARMGAASHLHCYVIWRSAESPELAKRFLVDLVAAYNEAFRASEFYNIPSFPASVSDLRRKLAADRQGPGRYVLLADAERWSAGPGYPGYATPAIEEVVNRWVIPDMFIRVARGEQGPEDSARQAEAEMKRIFARWTR